jgi:hypothetical protein
MNSDQVGIWTNAVLGYFTTLSEHLHEETENLEKPKWRIADNQSKIWSRHHRVPSL